MKQTALHQCHLDLNAKMVDFFGWHLPVQYTSIGTETLAVRQHVGMFDVSHMGEIAVFGSGSTMFVDWLLTRSILKKKCDQVTYALMLYDDGGTVDDLLAYRLEADSWWLVVNASNVAKDEAHIRSSLELFQERFPEIECDITIVNQSEEYAQIALQGHESTDLIRSNGEALGFTASQAEAIATLKRFRFVAIDLVGSKLPMIISRTGYTGENGFEIYCPNAFAPKIWRKLVELGVPACGLGARDALRLEAGLPLYGHEISADISPLEAGLPRFVELEHAMLGAPATEARSNRIQIALKSEGKSIPRENYRVFATTSADPNPVEVGYVTSGSYSPTLEAGIAMAIVADSVSDDAVFAIEIRGKLQPMQCVALPFCQPYAKA